MATTIHLRSCRRRTERKDEFPFSVPAIASLRELEFESPVTFFVGENGSGKSTLLEAMAINGSLTAIGALDAVEDPTLRPLHPLADDLILQWRRHPRRGFFLRAEDYFAFTARNRQAMADLKQQIGNSRMRMEKQKFREEYRALERRYGGDLDHRSHGESFLQLFQARIVPNGIYLIDEPEAALSPQRQLSLLSLLKSAVTSGSQFVIATHSPILVSFPDAGIFEFAGGEIRPAALEEIENVRLTREFLQAPERYLRHL